MPKFSTHNMRLQTNQLGYDMREVVIDGTTYYWVGQWVAADGGGGGGGTIGPPDTLTADTTNANSPTAHTHDITTTNNAITTPSEILDSDSLGGLTLKNLGLGEAADVENTLRIKANDTAEVCLYIKRIANQTGAAIRIDDEDGNLVIRTSGTNTPPVDAEGAVQYTLDVRGPTRMSSKLIAAAGIILPTEESDAMYTNRYMVIDGIRRRVSSINQ